MRAALRVSRTLGDGPRVGVVIVGLAVLGRSLAKTAITRQRSAATLPRPAAASPTGRRGSNGISRGGGRSGI